MARPHLAWIALIGLACEAPPRGSAAVTAPDAWALGDVRDDPLPDHEALEPDCPPGTWGYEDGRLEVQTGACAYAWLVQPARIALDAGDPLTLVSWHQGLDAEQPAIAHLALVLDGDVLWEVHADIPSPPDVFDADVEVPRDVPAGALVGLHLHNHGFNSWSVGDVTRDAPR